MTSPFMADPRKTEKKRIKSHKVESPRYQKHQLDDFSISTNLTCQALTKTTPHREPQTWSQEPAAWQRKSQLSMKKTTLSHPEMEKPCSGGTFI
jgi:hypothetical protein